MESEPERMGPESSDSEACQCESECECVAFGYHEFKYYRDIRKSERWWERKDREEIERRREHEKANEEEVREAFKSLERAEEKGEVIPVGQLARREFLLYNCDTVEGHFYDNDTPLTKTVTFDSSDADNWRDFCDDSSGSRCPPRPKKHDYNLVEGSVCLGDGVECNFGPLPSPQDASRKVITKKSDTRHELSFQFIGNGYLKMTVPRELVFMNHQYNRSAPPPPPTAPETYEFFGIRKDLVEARDERRAMLASKELALEREHVKAREEEVRAVLESLGKAEEKGEETPIIGSLVGKEFMLYCSGAVEHFYSDMAPSKTVVFHRAERFGDYDGETGEIRPDRVEEIEARGVDGMVYLAEGLKCDFESFHPPKNATQEAIKVAGEDGHELSFQLLGNGYLKMTIPREVVYYNTPPPTAPETFEFVGIYFDRKGAMERAHAKDQEERARNPPASPRESWFEMNHPMGSWAQDDWD